jgi:hypothetical protein
MLQSDPEGIDVCATWLVSEGIESGTASTAFEPVRGAGSERTRSEVGTSSQREYVRLGPKSIRNCLRRSRVRIMPQLETTVAFARIPRSELAIVVHLRDQSL